jgi:hypothetical protein
MKQLSIRSYSALPLLAALALVCLASLALAARAEAFVYWTNVDSIGRANNDGTGADQTFIGGTLQPMGVVVDGQYIYWTQWNGGSIARAALDGSGVDLDFITGIGQATGLAVDKTSIYWITYSPAKVGRANLDGSGVNRNLVDPRRTYGEGIAVYGSYLYWTWGMTDVYHNWQGGIDRAKVDGSGYKPGLLMDDIGKPGFWAIWAGPTYLYWTDGNAVGRATTPYADFDKMWGMSAPYSQYGLTKEGDYLYWTGTASIGRSKPSGTDWNDHFITTATAPHGVAADAETPVTMSLYTLRREIRSAAVDRGISQPLRLKLARARARLLRGDRDAASALLLATARQIRAQRGGRIPSALAAGWLRVIATARRELR